MKYFKDIGAFEWFVKVYLLFSFFETNLNIVEWSDKSRAQVVVITLVGIFLKAIIKIK